MSRDIFTDFTISAQRAVHDGIPDGSLSRARDHASSSNPFPRSSDTQKFVDAMEANNMLENREKAIEAEMAERERKRMDFHFNRAIPRCIEEGWKLLREELTDEEIRVYTIDNERRRFWGIKPAGIGTYEFWEQIDPEVRRYNDKFAMTWADPLIRPPFNTWEGDTPVFWAGQGINPDAQVPEPDIAQEPPPTRAAKPRRRPKTPEVKSTHRVRKSKAPSPEVNRKSTRKPLAGKAPAEHSRPEDQLLQEQNVPPATDSPSQDKTSIPPPHPKHKRTTKTKDPAPLKSTQSRPSRKATAAPAPDPATSSPQPPKRPRGRPAKAQPATKDKAPSSPKRSRGRPPGKGKSAAVQGNARVTKASSQQKGGRALAPSTHVMRTRGKGTAELVELP